MFNGQVYNAQGLCEEVGGTFTNGQCSLDAVAPQLCTDLGGDWKNGHCDLSDNVVQQLCVAFGGKVGDGQCKPPTGLVPPDSSPTVNTKRGLEDASVLDGGK